MRYYDLLNFQHIVLYLFPALIFILLFGLGLAYAHLRGDHSEERFNKIQHVFPTGIQERRGPFPAVLLLIILGIVMWAFFYILGYGLLGVKL